MSFIVSKLKTLCRFLLPWAHCFSLSLITLSPHRHAAFHPKPQVGDIKLRFWGVISEKKKLMLD